MGISKDKTNDPELINLSENYLLYEPWQDDGAVFNVTVGGWNVDYGDSFVIDFDYEGENA